MIDPVQNLPLDRLQAQRPKTESPSARKPVERSESVSFQASRTDSASVSFNLRGDLQSLRDSTETVFREVREQLERTYSFRNPGSEAPEEGEEGFQPPEDASAQELLEFFSPANTAQRIVEFSTGFVDAFLANRESNSEATEEELDEFVNLLGGAVEEGFSQAEGILGDFEKLGSTGENIQRTFELVLEGIREFREQYFSEENTGTEVPDEPPLIEAEGDSSEPAELEEPAG